MYADKIAFFYRDDMSPVDSPNSTSKSPTKPRRFMEFLRETPIWNHIELRDGFEPVTRQLLLSAHTAEYVDAIAHGHLPLAEHSHMTWSPNFRDTAYLTNGCLIAAITAATKQPQQVAMAPVSGFHHATPESGSGFCTFSGQVIAALKLYRERGLVGAWIDLDGHFGNSIEDSRDFAQDLDSAIPRDCNLNPTGSHGTYLADLERKLRFIERKVINGDVQYVCFAHGADSHQWDDLGGQCSTEEWLQASDMVYGMLARCATALAKPVPVALALFGGYRQDHPESVLGLHAMDTARCLEILCGVDLGYEAEVLAPR